MTAYWPARSLGAFVLRQQQDLLVRGLASWTTEGKPRLLHINCGDGAFFTPLHDLGFDLSACEHDLKLRTKAALNAPQGLEITAASADHLPFEDHEFHWALLFADDSTALAAHVAEAQRVASQGIAVMFWNSHSLSGLLWQEKRRPPMLPWERVWQVLRDHCGRRPQCHSIFLGPPGWWRGRRALRTAWHWSLPLGAWCLLRCQWPPTKPLTGLPLSLWRSSFRPQTVMERTRTSESHSISRKNHREV